MKINKKNPKHWGYLVISGINVFLSSPFRLLKSKQTPYTIVFYDQMNGNSAAFSKYLKEKRPEVKQYFLAFPEYHKIYPKKQHGLEGLSPLSFKDMINVAKSDVIITNFGIQTLVFYHYTTNIHFIDLWHGVPYKGFDEQDFKFLKRYSETWVSSETMKGIYESKYGVFPDQVVVTGYARVDKIFKNNFNLEAIRKKYKIKREYKKIILIAPTWKQDDNSRSIIPFGETENDFVSKLNDLGKSINSLIIFRAHRGSGNGIDDYGLSNVMVMPATEFPDGEEILCMTDIFVTDWSSMAFDFLPLHRPTIFLDVKPPFRKGFSLGPEYRFGEVVGSLSQLNDTIKHYAKYPNKYLSKYKKAIKQAEVGAYGSMADDKSCERYYERLRKIIKKDQCIK